MKKFTRWLLKQAEEIFLVAHGWQKVENDNWVRPRGYLDYDDGDHELYRTGHAVNSQKWCNRMRERR